MKKVNGAFAPLQKGKVRIIIRYRETGEMVVFEGMFNPDRNLDVIRKILRRRSPARTATIQPPANQVSTNDQL